jgi:uncharacterized protein YecA (UPF0149 family)
VNSMQLKLDGEALAASIRAAQAAVTLFVDTQRQVRRAKVKGAGHASFVGRNNACPCGSGKKFKKCCLGRTLPAEPPRL